MFITNYLNATQERYLLVELGPELPFVPNEFGTLDFLKSDVHILTNQKAFEVGSADKPLFRYPVEKTASDPAQAFTNVIAGSKKGHVPG